MIEIDVNLPQPPSLSPYLELSRSEWARLRADTPLTLSEADLEELRGINSSVDLEEVVSVFLPLSRLLNLYVTATQQLHGTTSTFLGRHGERVPYIIGIAGSVAVGKSTSSRILQALLSRWPNSPRVDLVTTDGFLWPNDVLADRDLMRRKGFPESYDVVRLLKFVSDIKAGEPRVSCPVYSHVTYDIVDGVEKVVEQPDIVIIEGLNVLQTPRSRQDRSRVFVSDYFDFSIYVDADLEDLRRWYIERFLMLRDTAFQKPKSYFHRYASMTDPEAVDFATSIWSDINEVNLFENILPTRERADLILKKGASHAIESISLRKL